MFCIVSIAIAARKLHDEELLVLNDVWTFWTRMLHC